jgi:spore coat protein U-like protein
MLKGSDALYYNLYIDAARTAVWGDGSGPGQIVTASFPAVSRTAKIFNIYGRVVALQNVAAGPYRDSIAVTVTY